MYMHLPSLWLCSAEGFYNLHSSAFLQVLLLLMAQTSSCPQPPSLNMWTGCLEAQMRAGDSPAKSSWSPCSPCPFHRCTAPPSMTNCLTPIKSTERSLFLIKTVQYTVIPHTVLTCCLPWCCGLMSLNYFLLRSRWPWGTSQKSSTIVTRYACVPRERATTTSLPWTMWQVALQMEKIRIKSTRKRRLRSTRLWTQKPRCPCPSSRGPRKGQNMRHEMMVCVYGLQFTFLTFLHVVGSVVVQDALPNRGWRSSWMGVRGKQIKTSWSLKTAMAFTEGVRESTMWLMWWVTGFFVKCTNPTKTQYSKYVFFFQSDPDQGQCSPHRSPSPTDDVFLGPTCSPPGHAPPPPPYMPPQPSIEEARQQMHSLLDDAFALVSPTSQGSAAGITLPGVNTNPPTSSPPSRGPRHWNPSYLALGPFPAVSMIPRSCADLLMLILNQNHVVYVEKPLKFGINIWTLRIHLFLQLIPVRGL